MVAMPFLLGVDTTILNKCSNFVHKIKYKGMEGKRYNNSFTSTGIVKEEGRAAYHKLLDSVRDGDSMFRCISDTSVLDEG